MAINDDYQELIAELAKQVNGAHKSAVSPHCAMP